MSNAISWLGFAKLSSRRALLPVVAIVVVSVCAFGTSIASAATPAKYTSSSRLTGTKTGKPHLAVTVSAAGSGGRKITNVKITLPSGFAFTHTKGHVNVAGKRFSSSARGRSLTVTPKSAASELRITVSHAAITESRKARASKAGRVRIGVTEQTTPGTKTKPGLNALEGTLKTVESQLATGQKALTTNVNGIVKKVNNECPAIAKTLMTGIKKTPGAKKIQAALLQSYDSFLLSSMPSLIKGYNSIASLLKPLGYTSEQPFSDLRDLAALGGAGIALESKQFCSSLKGILTTDTDTTLTSVEKSLEKQINAYAGDLTNVQAGFTKLENTLKNEAAAVQSVLSPKQLKTLTGLITSITGQLKNATGAGTTSSNPVAAALSDLLNKLSGGSLTGTSNPLSALGTLLGSLLSGLLSILGGL
jgi:hypothetical protein